MNLILAFLTTSEWFYTIVIVAYLVTVLSIIAVLFLTAARLPYAVTVVFLLLIVKGILVFRVHSV